MRSLRFFIAPLILAAAGCGSSIHDTMTEGPVDHGLYRDAVEANDQRLAGEDRLAHKSIVKTPLHAIGAGFDAVLFDPIGRFIDYITHDTPAYATRKMLDPTSADNRRKGTLRMTAFDFARKGDALKIYAHLASDDDYTVRAAGIRALNRCRAKGYTDLLLRGLEDDQQLVRLEAAKALANLPDEASIRSLIMHLQRDPNQDVRIACADALRNFKKVEAAKALIDTLNDHDFGVAWQSRQSLAMLTGQDFRYDEKAWLGFLSSGRAFG